MRHATFRIVAENEREQVLTFMHAWGMKFHECPPPPTEGPIIACWVDGEIAGTISLDFAHGNELFPLERLYDFRQVEKYFAATPREVMVQGGRWFARVPCISHRLIHAAAKYALQFGAHSLIGEAKDHAIRRMETLGFRFVVLYGIRPSIEHVPCKQKKYYEQIPVPKLFLLDLKHARAQAR